MATQLRRISSPRQLISLVPMIDVMLILLVFFMVTSTYLNLDMIPVVDDVEGETASGATSEAGATLLVRISADGRLYLRGQEIDLDKLTETLRQRTASEPLLSVVLLPSSQATTQNLVSAMDAITTAGVTRLRLMRLEAEP